LKLYSNFSLFSLPGYFIIIIIIRDVCIMHFFFLDNCFDLCEGFWISYFRIDFWFIFRVIVKVLHLNGCILVNLYLFCISISIWYVFLLFIFIFISYNLFKQIGFTLVFNIFRHCRLFILSFFFIFIYLFIYLLNDLFIFIVI
jgi:hypothetical protein